MFPREFLGTAWRNSGEKTWQEFQSGLERSRDDAPHDSLVDALLEVSADMETDGAPFPDNADDLFDVLKDQVDAFQPLSERGQGDLLSDIEYCRVLVQTGAANEVRDRDN
jgi:hypothetical protein